MSKCFTRLVSIFSIAFLFALFAAGTAFTASGYTRTDNGIAIKTADGELRLMPLAGNIVRVVFAPDPAAPNPKSFVVVGPEGKYADWKIEEKDGTVAVVTPELRVSFNTGTGALSFLDAKGNTILREPDSGARTAVKAVVADEQTYHAAQTFLSAPGEGLYGLGQYQDGAMNYNGKDRLLAQANTITICPFLTSTAGYGILWDNASVTMFSAKDGKIVFGSEVADVIDYSFVYGPDADRIIAGYRTLTGRATMLPKWAMGFFQSKERYKSQDELIAIVKEYRDRKLPLDVIVQDWWYWGKYGWSAMRFDEDTFPDPKGLMDTLHKNNAHIIISIWPKFAAKSDIFKEMDAKGLLYPQEGVDEGSRTYDAFSPEARAIYWKYANENIFSKGMDGWWMDATEPEIDSANTQELTIAAIRGAGKTAMGSSSRVLNAFVLMTTRGVYEGQRAVTSAKRVFILTRSTYAGTQRYGSTSWSGDIEGQWDVLRNQISGGLNIGLAGLPYWTTDIGGFHTRYYGGCENPEYRELYVRWFQFGGFCPIFRSHGSSTPREIWRFGEKGSWAYDALEKTDLLRYRLMPYIYSLSWMVTDKGYTIMRGFPFDFRSDTTALNINDEYMFGPAFLVAPVTKAMYNMEKVNAAAKIFKDNKTEVKTPLVYNKEIRTRDVYLPQPAEWYDFRTGEKTAGGQTVKYPVPVDIMPIYVRSGSIVPMGPFIQYATENNDPIELRIYPGRNASFTLYEDENDSYNYEKGVYATITFEWNDAAKTLTIGERKGKFPGMLEKRTFNVVVVRAGHGAGLDPEAAPDRTIKYDGKAVTVKF